VAVIGATRSISKSTVPMDIVAADTVAALRARPGRR
jgi:hypothetical protein